MVRVSCRSRCFPCVWDRRNWQSGAVVVSGVSSKAGIEGISEWTKRVIVWWRWSPCVRMGIIARCSNRIIGIVAIIIGKAEGWTAQIGGVAKLLIREACGHRRPIVLLP